MVGDTGFEPNKAELNTENDSDIQRTQTEYTGQFGSYSSQQIVDGPNHPADSPKESERCTGGASRPLPADLALVVNAWARLSDQGKRTILGLIAGKAEDRGEA